MRAKVVLTAVMIVCVIAAFIRIQYTESAPPVLSLPEVEQPARQSLLFLLDPSLDSSFHEAANLYAQKVSHLTDGYLTVEVRNTAEALADYRAGKGEVVFLDSRTDAAFCADFTALARPLRYKDYDNFTMALNSGRMLDFLGQSSKTANTQLLGAYYQGGNYFVTRRPLVNGGIAEVSELEEDDFTVVPRFQAQLIADNGLGPLLRECGLEPIVEEGATARQYALTQGTAALAEFTQEELALLDWTDTGMNVVISGHSIYPCWLAVSQERFQALPPKYQAVLREAAAYLFPEIDGVPQQREEQTIAQLRAEGMTVERGFPALRTAAEREARLQAEKDERLHYILGILNGME